MSVPTARRNLLLSSAAIAMSGITQTAKGQTSLSEPALIAAAADLQFALPQLLAIFHAQNPSLPVAKTQLGSSGVMATQMIRGAPISLLLSADPSHAQRVQAAGLSQGELVQYATGSIALAVPSNSPLKLDASGTAIKILYRNAATTSGSAAPKFAIANPEHAPYGRAAKQALVNLELWDLVQPHVVLGENIAQTTQYITSGAVNAGITAQALCKAPIIAGQLQWIALPPKLHEPLIQTMVLSKNAPASAIAFFRFMQSSAAKAVLAQYGLSAPPRQA